MSWPILRFVFRYRARGVEHLPREGGYVLAANHLSNFDPWALGMAIFPSRFLRFMAKSELFWFPLGLFIRSVGAFKVRRGEHDVEALRTAEQLAREGHVVVMFPEGTRRRKGLRKKWQPRAHTGAARIALGADVPLVPAAVGGTDRITRLAQLQVVYGRPIPLEGMDAEEATDRLMAEIRALETTL